MDEFLTTINRDSKVKYLTSEYPDAPALLFEYGSLINVLKYILSEGFNFKTVVSISRDPVTSIAKVDLARGHNYIFNQVVSLSGASQPQFNKDFRVLETGATYIKIFVEGTEDILEATTEDVIKINTSSLGFQTVFENETGTIMCFKNKSEKSPGILKVIDEIPPNGYSDTWGKYARVVFGQDIDELGNFVDNVKSPYWKKHPDVELTGNGVSGSGGVHGFAKWDYVIPEHYQACETFGGPYGVYPTTWKVIGDDKTFYILVWSRGRQYLPTILGFGNYMAEDASETYNLCLQARNSNLISDNREGGNYARTRNEFGVLDASNGGFLFANAYGQTGNITNSGLYRCESLSISSEDHQRPWRAKDIKSINPATGAWITNKLFIKDSENYLRGYHRGVQIMYGTSRLSDNSVSLDGDLILYVQTPYGSGEYESMPLLFSLRDWEYVE